MPNLCPTATGPTCSAATAAAAAASAAGPGGLPSAAPLRPGAASAGSGALAALEALASPSAEPGARKASSLSDRPLSCSISCGHSTHRVTCLGQHSPEAPPPAPGQPRDFGPGRERPPWRTWTPPPSELGEGENAEGRTVAASLWVLDLGRSVCGSRSGWPCVWGCVMSRSRGRTALSAWPQLHPQSLPPAGLQWSLRPRSLFAVS